jgi:hypothetical protein
MVNSGLWRVLILVTEVAVDLEHAFQTTDHQTFQIQLGAMRRYSGMSSALWWVTNGLAVAPPGMGASSGFPLPDSLRSP